MEQMIKGPAKLKNDIQESNDDQQPDLSQIMVVDDDAINIIVLQQMLTDQNFDSDRAMSGDEALNMIKARVKQKQTMYKLLFVDYSMPEMDGPTFTRELTKLCKLYGI